jgi:fibronectin type 3 domain-containing protein
MKKYIYIKWPFFILISFIFVLKMNLAYAAQIKLAWDSNMESDLKGYKIYYGTASKSYTESADVGKVTTFTLTGLTSGKTYYIIVTAYDDLYLESCPSIEVYGIAIEPEPLPPAPPPTITTNPTPTPTPPQPELNSPNQHR